MPTYDFTLAVNDTGDPQEGATFDFVTDPAGSPQPITDLQGVTIPALTSNQYGYIPRFKADATRGYIRARGTQAFTQPVLSQEATDGAQAAAAAQASAQAAATAAANSAAAAAQTAANSVTSAGQSLVYAWTYDSVAGAFPTLPATVPAGVNLVMASGPAGAPTPPSTGPWAGLIYLFVTRTV